MDQEKALTPTIETTRDVNVAAAQATALQEIQGTIILARQFPRNETDVWSLLMEAMKRESLAKAAAYSYPRGGSKITGPSVNLARVFAQKWGNIRWGLDIVAEDDESLTIRGWAWDVETNAKSSADDKFKKLIFRKKGGWIVPDERDLRELINRRGAILKRNCLLELLPRDFIEDALAMARKTLASGIKDPKSAAKKMILQFQDIQVTVEQLNRYVGHDKWDAEDIVTLAGVWESINDGNSKRDHYFKETPEPEVATLTEADVQPSSALHQGYDVPESGTLWGSAITPDMHKPIPDSKPDDTQEGELGL